MAKRTNGEGSAKWIVKNGVKYWRITITTGYDPLTGKQLRKDIYGRTQKEAKGSKEVGKTEKEREEEPGTGGEEKYPETKD